MSTINMVISFFVFEIAYSIQSVDGVRGEKWIDGVLICC